MSVFYFRRKAKAWFDYHVQAATGGPGLSQGDRFVWPSRHSLPVINLKAKETV
jgi:hypothetical protein